MILYEVASDKPDFKSVIIMIVVNDKAYITPNITLYPADLIRLTVNTRSLEKARDLWLLGVSVL